MKRKGCTLLAFVVFISCAMCQERYKSGPFKGFVKDEPVLETVEISRPFRRASLSGVIVYGAGQTETVVADAIFEIRDASGKVLSAKTDANGKFEMPAVPAGTYVFKATKSQFHPVVGTIVISDEYSSKSIRIQLQLGT
jgi:Carboxypeptidase regulatory-like domain